MGTSCSAARPGGACSSSPAATGSSCRAPSRWPAPPGAGLSGPPCAEVSGHQDAPYSLHPQIGGPQTGGKGLCRSPGGASAPHDGPRTCWGTEERSFPATTRPAGLSSASGGPVPARPSGCRGQGRGRARDPQEGPPETVSPPKLKRNAPPRTAQSRLDTRCVIPPGPGHAAADVQPGRRRQWVTNTCHLSPGGPEPPPTRPSPGAPSCLQTPVTRGPREASRHLSPGGPEPPPAHLSPGGPEPPRMATAAVRSARLTAGFNTQTRGDARSPLPWTAASALRTPARPHPTPPPGPHLHPMEAEGRRSWQMSSDEGFPEGMRSG